MNTFIRLPKVSELTGMSRSAIYAAIKAQAFPKQISLGPRTVAWLLKEVEDWINDRVIMSRQLEQCQLYKFSNPT